MDWNRSRFEYYLDFALVPFLVLLAVISDVYYHGRFAIWPVVAGFAVWTFAEYWIHRTLFHRVLRREHWLHHKRPGDYVAAPALLTSFLHLLVLAVCLGLTGAGFFVGLELGYLLYIVMHDAIHHRKHKPFGWLRRMAEHHELHHQGVEVNFGVSLHVWDKVFRTYRDPRQGGAFTARSFSGK